MALPLAGYAQSAPVYGYWQDVVQYSNVYGGGSARMNAIQNAQTGLGGDVSNASGNPAGLGFLRKSEFTFSPALLVTTTNNTQNGRDTTGQGSNFNIGQLGLVLANPKSEAVGGAFRGGAFAITHTRINNFNNYRPFNSGSLSRHDAAGNPVGNSYIDQYLNLSNQAFGGNNGAALARYVLQEGKLQDNGDLYENEYETRYAYSQFLIDTISKIDPTDGQRKLYFNSNIPTGTTRQSGRIYDKGYQNQFDLAYGFNLQDKLYLGGGIGVPYISQSRQVLYDERLQSTDSIQQSQYNGFLFTRREQYNSTGIGFNAKLGGIYKVNDNVRVGLSFQTPTWYSITSDYSFSLDANFVNNQNQQINYIYQNSDTGHVYSVQPNPGQNGTQNVYRIDRTSYAMRTPGNVSGGISFLSSKLGFVSLQGTLLPYSMARLGGTTYAGDNQYLSTHTQLVKQVRLGGEAVLATILRLRGGVAWLQNPVIGARDTWSYSAGLGVRLSTYYIDLSANVLQQRMSYQVYAYSPTVSSVANNVTVQVTLGGYF